MWVFLSRRLRRWLLAMVLLPFAGSAVHKLAVAVRERRPDARTTRLLGYADSGLMRVNRRAARKRGKPEPVYA
jgi:hypothetical protein